MSFYLVTSLVLSYVQDLSQQLVHYYFSLLLFFLGLVLAESRDVLGSSWIERAQGMVLQLSTKLILKGLT